MKKPWKLKIITLSPGVPGDHHGAGGRRGGRRGSDGPTNCCSGAASTHRGTPSLLAPFCVASKCHFFIPERLDSAVNSLAPILGIPAWDSDSLESQLADAPALEWQIQVRIMPILGKITRVILQGSTEPKNRLRRTHLPKTVFFSVPEHYFFPTFRRFCTIPPCSGSCPNKGDFSKWERNYHYAKRDTVPFPRIGLGSKERAAGGGGSPSTARAGCTGPL